MSGIIQPGQVNFLGPYTFESDDYIPTRRNTHVLIEVLDLLPGDWVLDWFAVPSVGDGSWLMLSHMGNLWSPNQPIPAEVTEKAVAFGSHNPRLGGSVSRDPFRVVEGGPLYAVGSAEIPEGEITQVWLVVGRPALQDTTRRREYKVAG